MSWAIALTLGITAGCSSSGSGSSGSGSSANLAIDSISVVSGATWKINRPIDVEFDQDIDFSTVNFNTFQIVDPTGVSASGVFLQPLDLQGDPVPNVVRFQPTCPTEEDFSDSGLQINQSYRLIVVGVNNTSGTGGITVQSVSGESLGLGAVVDFLTPNSTLPEVLFLDTVPGPPIVRVRGLGSVPTDSPDATYLEVGGDAANPLYFGANGLGSYEIPLNMYSDPDSQISLMLYLNQPVLASSANINSNQVSFEYESAPSTWEDIPTSVVLEQNCVLSGSILRVTPLGLIPQGSPVRVVVRQGFVDLTGDPTPADNTNFAVMASSTILVGGLAGEGADELLEEFAIGGTLAGSNEDTETPLGSPRAIWGETGRLEASFAFGGTGGPGGDFDYHVAAGQTITVNTTTATIVGGPLGAPTASQTVIGGVVDVRDMYVPAGSRLIFVGPNPVTILASGTVTIEGEISVRGGNNDGVGTLNTTFQPESGSAGNAGGGKGGTGSFLTSSSTPRGGAGSGPFNVSGGGGLGGETTYSISPNKDARRGAGGAGGSLGTNIWYDHDDDPATIDRQCQTLIGMDGEPGFSGAAAGTGAVSQTERADGGEQGPTPFVDERDDNNFYGTLITSAGELIVGELPHAWAGSGGGGGGDAAIVTATGFPRIPFQTGGDEKGSGAGGGGGGLTILAIGPIIVEDGGRVVADGGYGGGGENVIFFDRIGGGGGGGAGGHIVLSSASYIDVRGIAANAGPEYRDDTVGHQGRPIQALGGQGGAGRENHGGANENGSTLWRCDSIKLDRVNVDGIFETVAPGVVGVADDVPPLWGQSACFSYPGQSDWLDPEGPTLGAGGDGSPGIVQMHVDDPAANLRFAGGMNWTNADVTMASAPTPIGWNGVGNPTDDFVAFFGRVSIAQSEWIPLGLARVDPNGGPNDQVTFFFDGTDPTTGFVRRNAGGLGPLVEPLADIIPAAPIATGGLPAVDPSGLVITMDGSGLANEYKVNPKMLINYSVVLSTASNELAFTVADAGWRPGDELVIVLGGSENFYDDFIDTMPGIVSASLRPNFFRVSSQGVIDNYVPGTGVRIRFDATMLGADGLPDEDLSYSWINGEPTADITDLNNQNWDVFRVRVEFDLNIGGGGVNPLDPRPSLEFLKIPFKF
ncbi:MAG: hypothetical protein GY930_13210 [bacterium]|nr:hypothetical protein [bacterium]